MDTQKRFFRPRAEMLLDLFRNSRFGMTFPHGYTKFKHLVWMGKKTGAKVLIEAGSFHGVTAERAARKFERVITVEYDPANAKITAQRLAKLPNAESIEGDVLKELPKILARPDVTDALIYLDGHYSGHGTGQTDSAEPACEAVDMLEPFASKIAGFVVDDFRCFGRNEGFPSKSSLLRAIETRMPSFDFTVQYDQVIAWRRR